MSSQGILQVQDITNQHFTIYQLKTPSPGPSTPSSTSVTGQSQSLASHFPDMELDSPVSSPSPFEQPIPKASTSQLPADPTPSKVSDETEENISLMDTLVTICKELQGYIYKQITKDANQHTFTTFCELIGLLESKGAFPNHILPN